MSVIIRNGKPQISDPLCNSCYWAYIQRGFAESEEIVFCAFLTPTPLVPFKVSQCTDYNDKRVPSRKDMEDIAWIIRTKDVNRQVGFAKGEEVDDEEEDDLEIVPSDSTLPSPVAKARVPSKGSQVRVLPCPSQGM